MADEGSPGDERMSPRERRAQRASAQAGGGRGGGVNWKRYRVHIIIILLWAVATAGIVAADKYGQDCPGHWHSTMDVWVDGQKVVLAHPKFQLEGNQGMPISTHMHRGSEGVWHFEPSPSRCIDFEEALGYVDIDLQSDRMVLDGAHADLGQDGTFVEGGNNTLTAYYKPYGGSWHTISSSRLNNRQLADGSSVLILYGDYNETQVQEYQDTTIPLPGNLRPAGDKFPLVPVMGVTILAVVILAVWNGMSRKM